MKHGKRILSLLLVAVLMLALLPTAYADPPQNDPTHRHKWKMTSRTEPTCETEGKKTWKCSACGKTYTETSKALGHDWDEGVITTEPFLFTPGVKTFTCKRDASHTYTEEIEPNAEAIFALLHGETWHWMPINIDPLIITEQPKGGAITRYEEETHTMSVAVIGGEGAYTYEWHSSAQELAQQEQYNAFVKWFVGLFGITPEEVDAALSASLSDTDTLTVSDGNVKYRCTVRDEADGEIESEWAEVRYKIRIADQPDHANLQPTGTVELSCLAADGSGDYTYRWYDSELVFKGQGAAIPITEEGDYFCTVEDNVTGETVDSEMCTVYAGPPLKIFAHSPNVILWPEEEEKFNIWVEGGVEPYEVWARRDGELVPVEEKGRDEGGRVKYTVDANDEGVYTFYITDDWYANTTCTITRTNKQLTIKSQPVGKSFPENGNSDLSITMLDGTAPFTFILYRNGEECDREQRDSYRGYFNIWFAGDYYVHIIDAKGHSTDSKHVAFDNEVFQIRSQTETATIVKPYSAAKLEVEAVKGIKPYSYDWSFYGYNETENSYDWFKTGGDDSYCYAYYPGRYRCLVRDKQGRKLWAREMTVSYVNNAPLIVKQPKDRTVKVSADGKCEVTLDCKGVCGSKSGTPCYEWYWRAWEGDGRWYRMTTSYDSAYKANRTGMFACKVSDDSTGEFTWTNTAVVSEKLANTKSEAWKGSNAEWYFYRFSFTGGVGPYEVEVSFYNAENKNEYRYLYETKEVLYMAGLNEMTMLLPKYRYLWNAQKNEFEYARVGIIVTVTDALGHECKSTPVCWK